MFNVEGRQLKRPAAPDFLVQLGQLPAYGQRPVGILLGERRQGRRKALGRLKRHQRLRRTDQHSLQLRPLARQEADKRPVLYGQTRGDDRREHAARTRQHFNQQPGLDAGLYELVARVRYKRHPGVGDERNHRTLADPPDELPRALALVVLVITHELAYDLVAVQ